jgi:hypothetical protein
MPFTVLNWAIWDRRSVLSIGFVGSWHLSWVIIRVRKSLWPSWVLPDVVVDAVDAVDAAPRPNA